MTQHKISRLPITEKDLKRELDDLRERFHTLADSELFVLWFLCARVTEDEKQAASALAGVSGDKGVDAVFVDDEARLVSVVQGKYRQKVGQKSEGHSDVTCFANLACALWGTDDEFSTTLKDINPATHARLSVGRERLKRRKDYKLRLYYVTTGKCSTSLSEEANRIVRRSGARAELEIVDHKKVFLTLSDYLDGVAPPVASLDLEIESGSGVRGETLRRKDSRTGIYSWVFSMTSEAVADMYSQAGIRLFARNIRGFLDKTTVNRNIENTLASEPEYFWYYNNGITIVCGEAEQRSPRGRDVLHVVNPQVINGQQTTRIIHRTQSNRSHASVLVRVIVVPRDPTGSAGQFETLVSKIVAATNWQNEISASDLMSNDRRQIELDRALRKIDYYYLRKRQKKSEARRFASMHYYMLKKEDFAQAVAACDLDPAVVREGKEVLFEERLYPQVFPTSDPNYYLSRYRLLREVNWHARGYRDRVYAKWLVLHFVWGHLAPLVRSASGAMSFRLACEGNTRPLAPLSGAIQLVFSAALDFYRQKRKKDPTILDVSTLFKRKGLHNEFERFWHSSRNRRRARFRKTWNTFVNDLEEEERE